MLKVQELAFSRGVKKSSFNLESGKIYALVGENGAGKSTLLKLLSGLLSPASGEVILQNTPLSKLTPRERAKKTALLLPQFHAPFPYTVEEIVRMGRYMHGDSVSSSKPHIAKALTIVNASHLQGRLFSTLSSGEKQLILIARLLATEAPLLLMDEPAATLDLKREKELWELLTRLKKEGKTILAAIHHLEIALPSIDKILILKNGDVYPISPSTWSPSLLF